MILNVISCENEKDKKLLKQFVLDNNYRYYGPFKTGSHNYPFYYYLNENRWQDVNLSGKWYCKEATETYQNAIPMYVVNNPEQYPEYFI